MDPSVVNHPLVIASDETFDGRFVVVEETAFVWLAWLELFAFDALASMETLLASACSWADRFEGPAFVWHEILELAASTALA